MRHVLILMLCFLLVFAEAQAADRPQSTESDLAFLLDAAAKDFHTHQPPMPVAFRQIRFGYVVGDDQQQIDMICGEFLPETAKTQSWEPFVTIKTSGYEQWLGVAANTWCDHPEAKWQQSGDHSQELMKRLKTLSSSESPVPN